MKYFITLTRCYEILRIPHRILVLQDMKAFGYSAADRVIGLDEGHLEVVLKKIAKFHAASMIVLSKVSLSIRVSITCIPGFVCLRT